ncbi:hypothetical protein [Collinsella phocaeensis]|uniref:hypothetical protein n=1 Tax=Collinsella phocaeensis TaxID=1871016 RepID=UPI000ADDD0C6|nr:hypothetical protein [Collinsella phocaeensis]
MPSNRETRRVDTPWGTLAFETVPQDPQAEANPAGTTSPHADGPADGARTRADGRRRASRAAQFMPFAALTGYYDLVREQERIVEPRHELTEEEAVALSRAIMQTKKGDLVRVTYYDRDGYVARTGIVSDIELTFRRLHLGSLCIAFDDMRDIERHGRGRP